MSTPTPNRPPNPGIIFETLTAYQRTAALKAAIDLELFTEMAKGSDTVEAIAKGISASPRGVRILCDFLTIIGFLTKEGDKYSLGLEAKLFLDKSSPAYFGSAARFLLDPKLIAPYLDLAQVVRDGRTTLPSEGVVSDDNPIWVEFAESMAPMLRMPAQEIAEMVASEGEIQVLDIAAGHGLFGISIAQKNPKARVVALDWPHVLEVATRFAAKLGVADRHTAMAGDAFTQPLGGPYDIVLVTNFFHHFDIPTCEGLVKKIFAALKPGGKCLTLDFIPNEDRVSPPAAAAFALMMLGTTVAGDAYTFAEYQKMFDHGGFASSEIHTLTKWGGKLIVSKK